MNLCLESNRRDSIDNRGSEMSPSASTYFAVSAAIFTTFVSLLAGLAVLWRRSVQQAEALRKKRWLAFIDQASSADHGLPPDSLAACEEAGMRVAECDLASQPLHKDPVAKALCGTHGQRYGHMFTKLMMEQEGSAKSSQMAVRARVLDDDLSFMLASVVKEDADAGTVQVVCLGAGMDTRPWRLRRGGSSRGAGACKVVWYEVDQPSIMELKNKLLQEAGVEVDPDAKPQGKAQQLQQQRGGQQQYPVLAVDKLHSIGSDPCQSGSVASALTASGFSPSLPTIWVLEGLLLSRMEVGRATSLLRECGRLSPPNSRLLATVLSKDCLQAVSSSTAPGSTDSAGRSPRGFHTSGAELLASGLMEGLGWGGASLSVGLAELARTRYKVDCYPYYGRFASPAQLAALTDVEHVLMATRI